MMKKLIPITGRVKDSHKIIPINRLKTMLDTGNLRFARGVFMLLLILSISETTIAQELHNESSAIKSDTSTAEKVDFILYGKTAISSSDKVVEALSGTQKFDAEFILKHSNFTDTSKWSDIGMSMRLSVNTLNLQPTSISSDSLDLLSLMFPETGNAGFSISPQFNYCGKQVKTSDKNIKNYSLGGSMTYSVRQSKVRNILKRDSLNNILSSNDLNFSAINLNVMPLIFSYDLSNDDFNAKISIGTYVHVFNIPDEDATSFNELFPIEDPIFINSQKSSLIYYGAKAAVDINGFGFFMDVRNLYREKNLSDNNPFTGFTFNAGFTNNLKIFSK